MMGISHLISGVAVGLGACAVAAQAGRPVGPLHGAVLVVAWAVGALAPDVDTPGSIASRHLAPWWTVSRSLRRTVRLWGVGCSSRPTPLATRAVQAVSAAVYRATRTARDDDAEGTHRYLTHTAVAGLAAGGALAALIMAAGMRWPAVGGWWWIGAALTCGWWTHLAGDWLTPMGVPLVWPLRVRGRRWWRFRSPVPFGAGSWVERWLVRPVLVVGVVLALLTWLTFVPVG